MERSLINDQSSFTIGLFEIGDCYSCLHAWCCPHITASLSRGLLDGSDFCVNCCCLPLVINRWLTRSAYGIGDLSNDGYCGGAGCNDCLVSIFCPCCTINQIYQTVKARGRPASDGGKEFNTVLFHPTGDMVDSSTSGFSKINKICCAACCPCLRMGTIMKQVMGMPWCMGCCCVPMYLGRNIVRYQYRISTVSGSECIEECVWPLVFYYGIEVLAAIPFCTPCAYGILVANVATTILSLERESELRQGPTTRNTRYLVGYSPTGVSPMDIYVKAQPI